MTANQLLDAIGMIDDADIWDAKKNILHGYNQAGKAPTYAAGKYRKRRLLCIAAVIALLLSSFAAAMAVNKNFRTAVFSFFHISAPDVALSIEDEPQPSDTIEKIYESTVEDSVNIDYIKTSENFNYGQGLIYLYGEADGAGAFYTVRDGALKKLQTNELNIVYVWEGSEYLIDFDWCREGGEIYANSIGKAPASDASWYVSQIPGNKDTVALTLAHGRQDDYSERTLLLTPDNGEVTDPFAGSGADQPTGIVSTEFSSDLSMALITSDNGASIYFCDLSTGELRIVSEFTSSPVSAAWFLNDSTICCIAENESDHCDCYRVSPSSGGCAAVFEDLAMYSPASPNGVIFTGTRYGMYIESDKTTCVLDFQTGARMPVEGLLYAGDSMTISSNSAGTKILIAMFDQKADGLGIAQLGVIDIERRTFTLLDREGYEIRDESAVGWFDNDRISVLAESSNGEKYLYLYSFTR